MPLLSTLSGRPVLAEMGKPLPAFDLHCPLMSLPLAFHTQLDSIPAPVPYLFADNAKRSTWAEKLGPKSLPRIGLVWSGRKEHLNDRNRSIPLQTLEPLLELPLEFYSLQKEYREADKAFLKDHPQVKDHSKELDDFSNTAALMANLDLIVSVDTSTAHLAGALGLPLWLLLPFSPDYRWLLNRKDSPWYPTAELFRQPAWGDWKSVIEGLKERLKERFSLR